MQVLYGQPLEKIRFLLVVSFQSCFPRLLEQKFLQEMLANVFMLLVTVRNINHIIIIFIITIFYSIFSSMEFKAVYIVLSISEAVYIVLSIFIWKVKINL